MSASRNPQNAESKKYWTTRDFTTSARLHLQNWINNYQFGYVLHPSIPKTSPDLKVADIACGNGAWLVDLHPLLPSTAMLHGFDISTSGFPPQEWLPSNMALSTINCFEPLPSEMIGAYDIVHIRAIITAVVSNDPSVLIENLLSMLKPGGHLQWDESDGFLRVISSKGHDVSKTSCQYLGDYYKNRLGKVTEKDREWVYKLPSLLTTSKTEVVYWSNQEHMVAKPMLIKPWTEDILMAMMDFAGMAPEIVPAGEKEGFMTKSMWGQKIHEAANEREDGVGMYFPMVEVVVRKNKE